MQKYEAVSVIRTILGPKNGSFRCLDKLEIFFKQPVLIQTNSPKIVQTKFPKFRHFGNCLKGHYLGSLVEVEAIVFIVVLVC
jgi:hypothetical protein